ncbi:MAG: glycosyltransferase family 4 protein [Planctomycetota bacterium]
MKLVFVTQVYNPDHGVLGFVPRWVQGLAANCEKVLVLALEAGENLELPANVEVHSLGRKGRLNRYLKYYGHLRRAFGKDGYEALLAHMVPRYASLGDKFVRRSGGRTYLWYTHKGVDARLKRAVSLVDKVFTASDESLRIDTPKKVVTGHGIDAAHFAGRPSRRKPGDLRLLSVGRLTPAKDPITLIKIMAELHRRGVRATLEWVGAGLVATDEDYAREVLHQAEVHRVSRFIEWADTVPYPRIAPKYHQADLFLSSSLTGSVDKVVLEAMASGMPVLVSGEAYPPLWTELGSDGDILHFQPGAAVEAADKIIKLWNRSEDERNALGARLQAIAARDHQVDALMARLVQEMRG